MDTSWAWLLWTVLGVILIVAEIFTPGFVLLWFGIGALAAAFASLVGLSSLPLQFLIFAIVSTVLTAASRTIFVNYFSHEKTGTDLKTGVDGLPGKTGIVVSSSRGASNRGEIGAHQLCRRRRKRAFNLSASCLEIGNPAVCERCENVLTLREYS